MNSSLSVWGAVLPTAKGIAPAPESRTKKIFLEVGEGK